MADGFKLGNSDNYSLSENNNNTTPVGKKGTTMSRFTNFLGSGKKKSEYKPDISYPSDFKHDIHVGFDPTTGEFSGMPAEWKVMLQNAGIDKQEQGKNPETVINVLKFYNSQNISTKTYTEKYMSTQTPEHHYQLPPIIDTSLKVTAIPEVPPRPISTKKQVPPIASKPTPPPTTQMVTKLPDVPEKKSVKTPTTKEHEAIGGTCFFVEMGRGGSGIAVTLREVSMMGGKLSGVLVFVCSCTSLCKFSY